MTIAATVITLGTFIKDVVELGEGIRSSIEKVGENRRQIRELSQDIVRTLYALASLTRGKEDTFRVPELLSALEHLKAEMLDVHLKCAKISPVQLSGLRRIKSQINAWKKRGDLEKKIARLRERVNKCFLQFTASRLHQIQRIAFSAARTEHVALRIEQKLVVDGMENQVKARRLEGMMAQVLLNSTFGRHKLGETIEIIASDPTFRSLESQYISAQLKSLISSIERLLASGNLTFELTPSAVHIRSRGVFIDSTILTPSHALIQLLQLVVEVNGMPCVAISLQSMRKTWSSLVLQFSRIGMFSEAIAWGQLNVACFRHASKTEFGPRALPEIANNLHCISQAHRCRSESTLAVQSSRQSLHLWIQSSKILPGDHRISILASMVMHADNLLMSDQKAAALAIAKDAVSIARALITGLVKCISKTPSLPAPEELEAAQSRDAYLVLARVFSSLDRHLDSYAAFMAGFQTAHRLPVPVDPPAGSAIHSFSNVICKLAQDGHLSLSMLAECMMLFRDLTRIYQEQQIARQFLGLLHTFAYFSQQGHSPSSSIRYILLSIPDSRHCVLDNAKLIPMDSAVLEDAVRIFYTDASERYITPLIRNIWVAHFQQAISTVKTQCHNFDLLGFQCFLNTTCGLFQFSSKADCVGLLKVLASGIERLRTKRIHPHSKMHMKEHFVCPFLYTCQYALNYGLVDEGLQLSEQIIKYLKSWQSHTKQNAGLWLGCFLRFQISILCDATRFSEAIQLVHHTVARLLTGNGGTGLSEDIFRFGYCLGKARILKRLGRHSEALQIIRKAVAADVQVFKHKPTIPRLHLYFLLVEQAAVSGFIEVPQTALAYAEQAVTACQEVDINLPVEHICCIQIHSFTTLSNCLAAVGRNDEALDVAQKAMSLYTPNAKEIWTELEFTIRRQELGGNAFFALSRRLVTSGDKEQALPNCEKAIKLYRELVSQAPRHLPTLASSLQHIASILWDLGRQREAMAASKEAIQILRKVADSETYFLPIVADALYQLANFLVETGDRNGAGAATEEAAEARTKFAALPQGPEWLFEEVVELEWRKREHPVPELTKEAREGTSERDGCDEESQGAPKTAATQGMVHECDAAVLEVDPSFSSETAAPSTDDCTAANCTAHIELANEPASLLDDRFAPVGFSFLGCRSGADMYGHRFTRKAAMFHRLRRV
ncbi:Tetratricopeptide repeat family [Favolaschia claudopus]|uniref:Tetratricopeptide repeat family n=1 Tax=Favolaschia claudopus TaxID=2862362 RepID=A0AAW0A1N7_9AGAR